MSAIAWLAVAGGIVLVPTRAPVAARLGSLAGADRLLGRASVARRFVPPAVPRRWAVLTGGGLATLVVLVLTGPALAIATAVLLGVVGVLARDVRRARERAATQRELLTSVQVLVAELESGAGPPAALEAAASVAPRHGSVFAAAGAVAARGDPTAAVLGAATDPVLRAVGFAWQIADDTGAPLAGVLGRVAIDLEAAQRQRRTVTVALAGPKSSGAVLSGLPVLGIGLGAAMGARPLPFLLTTPPGRLLCCAGVLLDAAGVMWMRRILRRAERPP